MKMVSLFIRLDLVMLKGCLERTELHCLIRHIYLKDIFEITPGAKAVLV